MSGENDPSVAERILWHLVGKCGMFLAVGENRYGSGVWMGLFPSAQDAQQFEDTWTGGDQQYDAVWQILEALPFFPVITSSGSLQEGFTQLVQKLETHFGVLETALPKQRGLHLLTPISYQQVDAASGESDTMAGDYWDVMDELRTVWSQLYQRDIFAAILPEEHPILCQLFKKTPSVA